MAKKAGRDEPDYVETIAQLEEALEAEKLQSQSLRDQLESLEAKIAEVEARVEGRLEAAVARAEKAEQRIKEQSERLESLGSGRESTMLALNEARSELALVTAERDKLRRSLTNVESMQTETLAFTEDDPGPTKNGTEAEEQLPSIEELMANLSATQDGSTDSGEEEQPEEPEWKEMISPEVIVAEAGNTGNGSNASPFAGAATQLLIGLDSEPPVEHALTAPLTTIGRSESADIPVDGNFISRIHARILVIGDETIIEDAGSKNGTRVNSEPVERCALKHGDLVRIGTARFRFVDRSAEA